MKQPKCPYCGSFKEKVYKKGEFGCICGDGWNEVGAFGEMGVECGSCNKHFLIFSQFTPEKMKQYSNWYKNEKKGEPPNIVSECFIKYDIEYDWNDNGCTQKSFKRAPIVYE